MLKHIKRMNNNCHISDLVQAFSYVGVMIVIQVVLWIYYHVDTPSRIVDILSCRYTMP